MLPGLNNVPFESPTLKEKRSIWRRFASLARLASTASAADGDALWSRKRVGTDTVGQTGHEWSETMAWTPFDFGAVGDGVTSDTLAFVRAAANLADGDTLDLMGRSYLISAASGATHQSGAAYGKVALPLTGLRNISVVNGEVLIASHDCSTGGLTFCNFKGCPGITFDRLRFDMTFTGSNTSGSAYPFCGAITGIDDESAGQSQDDLNGDCVVSNCEFKLFHPLGCFAQSPNAFGGDSNNGFKIFSVFVSGPYLATSYDEQCRGFRAYGNTFKEGHNAYGIWVWAWNDVDIGPRNTAEKFVTKYSNAAGAFAGSEIPWFRYHQWHCSGVDVHHNTFLARPCDDRGSGFEGGALFCSLNTNLTGSYSHGISVVRNNTVVLGNGDAANSVTDYGVRSWVYGVVRVIDNDIDGIATTTNAYAGIGINYAPEVGGGDGSGMFVADNNTFGENCSYINNIVVANGSSVSAADRRAKVIRVVGNTSLSQLQYFLDLVGGSAATYLGAGITTVLDNTVIGTNNTVYGPASTNSRALLLTGSDAADSMDVANNTIVDKYYAAAFSGLSASASARWENNNEAGITTSFLSAPANVFRQINKAGVFTPVVVGSSTAGAGTYTTQIGRYQRSGTRVHYDVVIVQTAHTGTGNLIINLNDIPWTSANINASMGWSAGQVQSNLVVGAGKQLGAQVANNSKTLALYASDVAGGAVAAVAMDGACSIWVSGWYEAF